MSFTDELLASKFDDIERDIGDMIQISSRALPSIQIAPKDDHRLPKGPMPDYVEHKEGVNQVGRLSAEAVVREYDAAVKEIEALGAELIEAAKKCEATVAGVHATASEIKALAASYREEGKRYFLQIEDCSLMTAEVRTVCEALKQKISKGTIAA
jgi:molybdopterin converting factor small subunit